MYERWPNQEEAYEFAMRHTSCMLDMEMGTGKTRVAIDVAFSRPNCYRVLVVCPKAVVPVWRENLEKFAGDKRWVCWDRQKGTIEKKAEDLKEFLHKPAQKQFVVINYDSVWRGKMGDLVIRSCFQMVILDESHRAKAAGSKVSKYLAMLGKRTKYKMCLSGTPMANSPLDVYGQYRFLNPEIFGTNHAKFLYKYAIMGGPEMRFVIGYKNQIELKNKFQSIAYTCKMSDISSRIKLPDSLPPVAMYVDLPSQDMRTSHILAKEFVAECGTGHVVVNNVLTKLVRLQQITSGFCVTSESVFDDPKVQELNTAKEDMLAEILGDMDKNDNVVVFCLYTHDIVAIRDAARQVDRNCFELSGRKNEINDWKKSKGAVFAVQIQAGAEGVDMTISNHAIYFSIPHSMALYNQSKARLYRPGQNRPVAFMHLLARGTIDESLYKTLLRKEDMIEAIKNGTFDFGFIK